MKWCYCCVLIYEDIVNRIMRKDNYIIALFNMNILNTCIPCTKISVLTKMLEWNILRVLDALFDESMDVRKEVLMPHSAYATSRLFVRSECLF